MRVAYILSSIGHFGPFIVARDIVNNIFNKVEQEIDVFYIKDSEIKLEFKATCKKISFLSKIDFSKYDIIHSHGFLADAFVHFNRSNIKCKTVVTVHQDIKPDYTMSHNYVIATALERLWCLCIKKSDAIVMLTKQMISYYKKLLPVEKSTFIYNGITPQLNEAITDTNDAEKILLLKKDYIILGVSARVTYRKGIDQIIRHLASSDGKTALVVIGDGVDKESLIKLAESLNVEQRCLFIGYKNNAIDYYSFFDIYVMSSRSEAFGLCVLEAASQKIPIVCSDLPIYDELFDGDEVVKFTIEDIDSLSKAIDFAINNKEVLGNKLYQKYLTQYTAQVMANNYFNLYSRLYNY